jgi:hypothetical protein
MYLSEISEKTNKKIDEIIKWFLFSKKMEYEQIKKAKISIERLISMKDIGSYGIKNFRLNWKVLKFKFLIDSINADNIYKEIITKDFASLEEKFKIKEIKEIKKLKLQDEDKQTYNDMILIAELITNLECKFKLKNLVGQKLKIGQESLKVIKWDEDKQNATLRNEKGERSEKEIVFELINNENNLTFSESLKYVDTIELKEHKITVKRILESFKSPLVLTKGQKKLNEKFNWNIEQMLKDLKNMKIIRKVKTLWYTILTNSIPTLENIHYDGKSPSDYLCSTCNKIEDLNHVFNDCQNANAIIKEKHFEKIRNIKWHEWNTEYLNLNLIRTFIIWKVRCDTQIGKKHRTPHSIENEIEELINRHKTIGLWD